MKKETIKNLILQRFRLRFKGGNNGFVNSQAIQDVIHNQSGHKHETVGRELRRLAEEGYLEKQEMKPEGCRVSSVYYKYIQTKNEEMSVFMKNQSVRA